MLIHGLNGRRTPWGAHRRRRHSLQPPDIRLAISIIRRISRSTTARHFLLFACRACRAVSRYQNQHHRPQHGRLDREGFYREELHIAAAVDHLILIGSPKRQFVVGEIRRGPQGRGSSSREWKRDPEWTWTWPITAGLGEARDDLKPGSKFLTRLNSLQRRAGVRYTVIAGSASADLTSILGHRR